MSTESATLACCQENLLTIFYNSNDCQSNLKVDLRNVKLFARVIRQQGCK